MLASTQNIKRVWCKHCSRVTKHETGFYDNSAAAAFALGFFTCGLAWLLIPVSLAAGREYACAECGTKRRIWNPENWKVTKVQKEEQVDAQKEANQKETEQQSGGSS